MNSSHYGLVVSGVSGHQMAAEVTSLLPTSPDHRQFDAAWNVYPHDLGEFGLMGSDGNLAGDYPFMGQPGSGPQSLDLHLDEVLDSFSAFNVPEVANHDHNIALTSQGALQEMLPSSSMTHSMVPSSSPYSGEYGFEVAVEKQPKTTKSASWLFVESLKKLFVMKDKPCPFLFKTSHSPPSGSIIRILPIYPTADHVAEIVTRCPTHAYDRKTQEDPLLTQHLIISEHQMAEHVQDSYSNRLNVVIPYEEAQVGAEWVTSLFQFKCLGSCQKVNDRRSWQVIFTLECSGVVLGRQVVMVHCCSSPGRDGLREEQKRFGLTLPVKKRTHAMAKVSTMKLQRSLTLLSKQRKMDLNDIYLLQIRGRERFEMMCKIRDSVQMSEHVNPDFLMEFRQQFKEMDDQAMQEQEAEIKAENTKPSARSTCVGKTRKRAVRPVAKETNCSSTRFGISKFGISTHQTFQK